jgi:hypothetical protein
MQADRNLSNEPRPATLSVLDAVAALLALAGLLPVAGGLPSITSPSSSFANELWFLLNLAGPALLLAAGLRPSLRRIPMLWYISGYTCLWMIAGGVRLRTIGFHRLLPAWLITFLCIAVLLLLLRRVWLWAIVGGLWSTLLLGTYAVGGIVAYVSAGASSFPTLLVIQLIAAITSLVAGVLHLRRV